MAPALRQELIAAARAVLAAQPFPTTPDEYQNLRRVVIATMQAHNQNPVFEINHVQEQYLAPIWRELQVALVTPPRMDVLRGRVALVDAEGDFPLRDNAAPLLHAPAFAPFPGEGPLHRAPARAAALQAAPPAAAGVAPAAPAKNLLRRVADVFLQSIRTVVHFIRKYLCCVPQEFSNAQMTKTYRIAEVALPTEENPEAPMQAACHFARSLMICLHARIKVTDSCIQELLKASIQQRAPQLPINFDQAEGFNERLAGVEDARMSLPRWLRLLECIALEENLDRGFYAIAYRSQEDDRVQSSVAIIADYSIHGEPRYYLYKSLPDLTEVVVCRSIQQCDHLITEALGAGDRYDVIEQTNQQVGEDHPDPAGDAVIVREGE